MGRFLLNMTFTKYLQVLKCCNKKYWREETRPRHLIVRVTEKKQCAYSTVIRSLAVRISLKISQYHVR